MFSQSHNYDPITRDGVGRVYKIARTAAGFSPTDIRVAVDRGYDGTYSVKLITPGGCETVRDGVSAGALAVRRGRTLAADRLVDGAPADQLPQLDTDQIPAEPPTDGSHKRS